MLMADKDIEASPVPLVLEDNKDIKVYFYCRCPNLIYRSLFNQPNDSSLMRSPWDINVEVASDDVLRLPQKGF